MSLSASERIAIIHNKARPTISDYIPLGSGSTGTIRPFWAGSPTSGGCR